MNEGKFKCPLCNSPLTESRYYEIVGVWEEKKKVESELKRRLVVIKETREKLLKEKKEMQDKLKKEIEETKKRFEIQFEKQKEVLTKKAREEARKLVSRERIESEKRYKKELLETRKEFLEKGKEYEKKRTDRLTESLKLKTEDWKRAMDQVKELKEQLKKGTTSQTEGINFEIELVKELRNKFPRDKIEHHGKGGDIHHYVVCEGKEIALIVYECKKTQKFSKGYITQIKNDVIKNNANYGVLVTFACDKKQSQFWVEKDILIVHPFGAPYIAEVLRKSLIQLYSLRLSGKELNERAKKLLEYIKSNKFRNSVKDNILRARELYELLNREMEYHKTNWEKRHEHYNAIANQSKQIDEDSKKIVGEDLGDEAIEVPLIEINSKKRKKKERLTTSFS